MLSFCYDFAKSHIKARYGSHHLTLLKTVLIFWALIIRKITTKVSIKISKANSCTKPEDLGFACTILAAENNVKKSCSTIKSTLFPEKKKQRRLTCFLFSLANIHLTLLSHVYSSCATHISCVGRTYLYCYSLNTSI